jgi:hypothetical protein
MRRNLLEVSTGDDVLNTAMKVHEKATKTTAKQPTKRDRDEPRATVAKTKAKREHCKGCGSTEHWPSNCSENPKNEGKKSIDDGE